MIKESEAILKNGITLTLKHYAAYNSEQSRTYCDSRATERVLREIYLKAFERPVKALKDNPLSIMTSCNKINGKWAGERIDLMREILRDEWGFKGFCMSDRGTRYDTDGNGNIINANSVM